jgi:hypothetical protein
MLNMHHIFINNKSTAIMFSSQDKGYKPLTTKAFHALYKHVADLLENDDRLCARVLPHADRIRVSGSEFGLRTPGRAPWMAGLKKRITGQVFPGQADVILRCKGMGPQPVHQEMGDDAGFWQVLVPLHESASICTTTAIYPDGPDGAVVLPSMKCGDWIAIRGDVWHGGSAVVGVSQSTNRNGIMPLLTFYYADVADE